MPGRDVDVVARFVAVLTSLDPADPVVNRFCRAGSLMLGADGAAITVNHDRPSRHTWSTTSTVAAMIEDAQDVTGEGPGFDAHRSGQLVSASFGAPTPTPWPLLADSVAAADFAGMVLAVPMLDGDQRVGVLVVHRRGSGRAFDLDVADFLRHTLGAAILSELSGDVSTALDDNWMSHARVHQATGMVVAQLRVPLRDAQAVLRARAYALGVSLEDVADEIVQRGFRFDRLTQEE